MNKKHIAIGILSVLLLTGCIDTTSSESIPLDSTSESVTHTTEQNFETEIESIIEISVEETQAETEDNYIYYRPTLRLMYNGEIYGFLAGSAQVEVDGKYYEFDLWEEAFIDAERMKNECEYIGESISVTDPYTPTRELELTYAISDKPCELYKIDENQILVYSNEDLEIPEIWSEDAIVYPGTYRLHRILIKEVPYELTNELLAKYYRYAERFPEDYAQESESEQSSNTTDEE